MSRSRLPPWMTLAVLSGAVLGSSGCVTTGLGEWVRNGFKVGPNYCKPPAPVAAEWIQVRDKEVQARHLKDWWTVFQDETLNTLVRVAYDQNPTLRVMSARVLEARAQRGSAAGNLFSQTQGFQGIYANGTANGHPTWFNLTNF